MGQFTAEQLHAGVATCQGPQYARPQLQPVPGSAVAAQRDLVRSAAAEVRSGVVIQHLQGVPLVVGERGKAGRDFLQCWSAFHAQNSRWGLIHMHHLL